MQNKESPEGIWCNSVMNLFILFLLLSFFVLPAASLIEPEYFILAVAWSVVKGLTGEYRFLIGSFSVHVVCDVRIAIRVTISSYLP